MPKRERGRSVTDAEALMLHFAERTGLTTEGTPRRYLWTDAFAVCNFLALANSTGEQRYRDLALRLVDQVHHVLGRHRTDDRRRGWISGLEERQGELHPTRGGLRIGKELAERAHSAPLDERLEWERDGQYFHYLTRWMHTLDQVSRSTGLPHFNTWARELAEVAHLAFTTGPPSHRAPVWKMSIDLSRPLVASMGHHDPLDGYITLVQLQTTARNLAAASPEPTLEEAVQEFADLVEGRDWATSDPLGLGGLLIDAYRVEQLMREGAPVVDGLLEELLAASLAGLAHYTRQGDLKRSASQRIAFREIGLAIGLVAVTAIENDIRAAADRVHTTPGVRSRLAELVAYLPLATAIETFWRNVENRRDSTWMEHRDINEVMLATRLVPEGMLVLQPFG